MRIGIAAARTPIWPKMDWLEEAAGRLGHETVRSTCSDELPPLLQSCDVVLAGHKSLAGRWVNIRRAVDGRRCPLVYVWFDLVATKPGVPIREQPLFANHRGMFQVSDLVVVKERDLVDDYRQSGANAVFIDQGIPSDYPAVEPRDEYEWDLLVWGQSGGLYRERKRDVRAVSDAGYRVAWATAESPPGGKIEHVPWTHPRDLPQLASRARCVLSCGARNDVAGYVSDSFWMAVGMGSCVLRKRTPGIPDGPYMVYHTHEELIEAMDWVRRSPEQARDLGRAARTWVMEHHTVEHRLDEILRNVRIAVEMAGCG
jgi:hypothetical protein